MSKLKNKYNILSGKLSKNMFHLKCSRFLIKETATSEFSCSILVRIAARPLVIASTMTLFEASGIFSMILWNALSILALSGSVFFSGKIILSVTINRFKIVCFIVSSRFSCCDNIAMMTRTASAMQALTLEFVASNSASLVVHLRKILDKMARMFCFVLPFSSSSPNTKSTKSIWSLLANF